jgi:hypothetical protein
MAAMSTYLKNALINETLRNVNYVPVSPIYIALYTGNPLTVGGEIAVGSYARQTITFINPIAGVTENATLITFPTATADWGIIAYFGIRDALTAGNLLYAGALTEARTILTGDTLTVPIGNLDITLT